MSEFNPSTCSITKALVTAYDDASNGDMKNIITGFELVQSMTATTYKGSLDCLDTIGMLDNMPMRGEESLELWITAHDNHHTIKLNARIYKISGINPSDDGKGLTYRLYFISEDSWNASKRMITRSTFKPVYEIVKQLFNNTFCKLTGEPSEYYDDQEKDKLPYESQRHKLEKLNGLHPRNIVIQKTDKANNLIIPRLNPQEAMYFLASRSYYPSTPSQTFRFFETFENYYFCTDEYFIKFYQDNPNKIYTLNYSPVSSLEKGGPDLQQQMSKIDKLFVESKGLDSAKDMLSGSYRSRVLEIDLIRKKVNTKNFNYDNAKYIDMSGDVKNIDDNPHLESFRDETFTEENAKQFLIFKNYGQSGDMPSTLPGDRMLSEILQNRISYLNHLNNTVLSAQLKGRLDLRPGFIIDLTIPNLDSDGSKLHSQLSGRYMIQSVKHSMKKDDTLFTGLKLVKFDWSGTNNV